MIGLYEKFRKIQTPAAAATLQNDSISNRIELTNFPSSLAVLN